MNTSPASDAHLIEQALTGKREAYESLVEQYQEYVFNLALRFVKSRENAEEVAQDSFMKAFRNLGSFQGQAKFSTWLYTIVYTTSMTFLRKNRVGFISLDDEGTHLEVVGHANESAGTLIDKKIKRQYIQAAIEQMLPDDAAVLTLFYLNEQSLGEISTTMRMPVNTVKVKLHRARKRFKLKLQGLLQDEMQELL